MVRALSACLPIEEKRKSMVPSKPSASKYTFVTIKEKKINTQATTMDKLVNEGTLKLVVNYIEDISSKLQSIDANALSNLLFLNHAFIVCNIVYNILDGLKRKGKILEIPFLIGFVCVMATGLGGAALNSLSRAKPQIIFFNDAILVFFLCALILTLYFPFGLIRRILSFPLFELVFYAFEGYFVSDIVLKAMNDAAIDFPTSNFGPIILGVLSANGGMILRPFILVCYNLFLFLG
jgi:hypothetical protein